MEGDLLLAMLVGCGASIGLNLGKGVQKMKVHVLSPPREFFSRAKRRDALIWLVGVALTGIAGLLFMVATNLTEKTSLVSSLNGVGLIALALFSSFVLAERVGVREWAAVLLIVTGTAIVQYFDVPGEEPQRFASSALYGTLGVCVLTFAVLLAVSRLARRGEAYVFAAVSGGCLGLMVVFFDLAGVAAEGDLFGMLTTPHFYVAILCGNAAFVFTNIAFFFGTATVVVPTVNSSMIVLPIFLEVFIFSVLLRPVQYLGVAVLVLGVVLLTTGKGYAVGEDEAEVGPAEG